MANAAGKRIGLLTGGGDCPGLNAVIRAVAKTAIGEYDATIIGIEDGFEGLVEGRMRELSHRQVSGILSLGGTILGTSNRGDPWHYPVEVAHGKIEIQDTSFKARRNITQWQLDALIAVGGDGTMHIADKFCDLGVNMVGVPKTIDNDLEGTLLTFGFDSAVACATDALDRLHTTAESHNRVMVLEVMGRYAGWIALYAGVAGGADVILIPEVPFTYDSICAKIQEREGLGKKFTLVIVAEGAREKDGGFVTAGTATKAGEARLGGIGAVVSAELERRTGKESRVCVLGHLQRGGSPTTFDRALCSMFGATAVELLAAKDFGKMVAHLGPQVGAIKISQAVGKLKTVRPDSNLVRTARALGISLGD
jgi:6-phosphofructokinase 1